MKTIKDQIVIDQFCEQLSLAASKANQLMSIEGPMFEVIDLELYKRGNIHYLQNQTIIPVIYYQNGVLAVSFDITPKGHLVIYVMKPNHPKYVVKVFKSQLPCQRETFIRIIKKYRNEDQFPFMMTYDKNTTDVKIAKALPEREEV